MNAIDFIYVAAAFVGVACLLIDTYKGNIMQTCKLMHAKNNPPMEVEVLYKLTIVLYGVSTIIPVVNVIMAILHIKHCVDNVVQKT